MRLIDADALRTIQSINKANFNSIETIQKWIDEQPTIEERKTGKWIHQTKFGRIECDQCGKVYRNAFTPKNYCPNCGARLIQKGAEKE